MLGSVGADATGPTSCGSWRRLAVSSHSCSDGAARELCEPPAGMAGGGASDGVSSCSHLPAAVCGVCAVPCLLLITIVYIYMYTYVYSYIMYFLNS